MTRATTPARTTETPQILHQIRHINIWAILVALAAIAFSTTMLYLTVGVHGAIGGYYDSASYLNGAVNLLQGRGFSLKAYELATDTIVQRPITHYPPLTSLVYAFFMMMGVSLYSAPSVVALCCWFLFLVGIGVLTYRLSDSWWAGAIGIVVASFTSSYLRIFQGILSEPLFLPLLVWSVVLLVGLPERDSLPPVRLGAVIVLLALMMLTRYAGVVIVGGIVLWWVWKRFDRQHIGRVVREMLLFALAFVPIAAWIVRNRWFVGETLGEHAKPSRYTFWDGISGALNQLSQLALPAMRPIPKLEELLLKDWGTLNPWIPWFHFGIQLALLCVLFLVGKRFWRVYQRRQHPIEMPSSPIFFILAVFVGLYVFVQPFASFQPMDHRDSTTLFCLLQPWLVAAIFRLLHRRALPILITYMSVNLLVIVIPVVLYGIPDVLSLWPLRVATLEGTTVYEERGVPDWLLVSSFRTKSVPQHQPEIMAFVRDMHTEGNTEVVIISTMTHIPYYDDEHDYLPARLFKLEPNYREINDWIEHGHCSSRFPVVLLVDTTMYQPYVDWVVAQTAEKCPNLTPTQVGDMLVYRLEHQERGTPAE